MSGVALPGISAQQIHTGPDMTWKRKLFFLDRCRSNCLYLFNSVLSLNATKTRSR